MGIAYAFEKDLQPVFSVVKTQDFSSLITKQSNNLINLEITFLTITASEMRHPVQHH